VGIQQKFNMVPDYAKLLSKMHNTQMVTEGVTDLKAMGIRYKAFGAVPYISGMLQTIKTKKEEQANAASGAEKQKLQQLVQYIAACIEEMNKK
jgi:aminopeptidase N